STTAGGTPTAGLVTDAGSTCPTNGAQILGTVATQGLTGNTHNIAANVNLQPGLCQAAAGVGTVTSVGFTGGLISVATPLTTPAFTVAGTSGGIPYFASGSTWASSTAPAANTVALWGGAGNPP